MNDRFHEGPLRPREVESLIERELKRSVAAPDLSRAIMGRLGYMRAAPAVVRRRRLRRRLNRAIFAACVMLTMLIGFHVHNASPQARRPLEMTIPAAVSGDLRQHQDRVQNVLRLMQVLHPSVDEEMTPDAEGDERPFERELDDDVNRSAIAPVRWV